MEKANIDRIAILFWVSLLGGLASLCGFLVSIAVPGDWRQKHIAVSSIVYILALIGIELYILIERGRIVRARDMALRDLNKIEAYRDSYQTIHSISHAFRDRFSLRFDENLSPVPFAAEDREFCLAVLDSFRDILQTVTDTRCATCIKTYVPSHQTMVTVARDSISAAERGLIDQGRVSSIAGNTGSLRVIQDGERYFFCNNLLHLFETDEYRNERPDWQHCYLSTIVWPIRKFDIKSKTSHIFGLLCVDSKKPDAFDRDACVQVGAAIGDMIYPYFCRINPDDIWRQFGIETETFA